MPGNWKNKLSKLFSRNHISAQILRKLEKMHIKSFSMVFKNRIAFIIRKTLYKFYSWRGSRGPKPRSKSFWSQILDDYTYSSYMVFNLCWPPVHNLFPRWDCFNLGEHFQLPLCLSFGFFVSKYTSLKSNALFNNRRVK